MHGLSVLRRWATTKTCRRRLVGRPCAAEGIYLDPAYTRLVWKRQCFRASGEF
ncbi:hypothetical protein RDI58_034990 [Solanum bulbocastanum]|uniref:Uncharacterized protein n=1 Tax=Solanum bulbocastanum TaxID=147425 RepID=A0AAN8XRC7_SOLBU